MDQMMGNLFYRGVPTESINDMSFFEMKEWNRWHEKIADANVKAADKLKS